VERAVYAIPGNDRCADCVTAGAKPTWASTNLGVVFCIRCSGVHRRMGAHVSKVLSLQIDAWSPQQLAHMRTLGNEDVNDVLEADLPPNTKPDTAVCTPADLEAYIRAKYELGSFREGGDGKLAEVAQVELEGEHAAACAAKAMAEFCGLLIIRLVRASNLPAMDLLGSTDAYVQFSLGERKATSRTAKKSRNPTWNETLSLNVRSLSESLMLKIFDRDRFGSDFIGQCLVPLADLTHDGMPMGFDLTIEQAKKLAGASRASGVLTGARDGRRMVRKGVQTASVAIELTYNPLDR